MIISRRSSKAVITGVSTSLVLSIATPLIGKWEGLRVNPYVDIAGVPTVCYGDTQVEMRSYTKDECDALLDQKVSLFAARLSECIDDSVEQNIPPRAAASFVSWSYNIGSSAACKSTLVRRLNAGDFEAACRELPRWNVANGQIVRGLVNRRNEEMRLCLEALEPEPVSEPSPNWVARIWRAVTEWFTG